MRVRDVCSGCRYLLDTEGDAYCSRFASPDKHSFLTADFALNERCMGRSKEAATKPRRWWHLAAVLGTVLTAAAPASAETDPSGACWPDWIRYADTSGVRFYYVADTSEAARACARVDGSTMACTIGPNPKHPELAINIVVLPKVLTPAELSAGWTLDGLMRHEVGHVYGVTRHRDELTHGETCE